MNPTLTQLELGKSHLEALLNEARLVRSARTPQLSWRQHLARSLKHLAAQLEPERRPAHS